MSLKIKVCGMRNRINIASLLALPVDFIGFIFYKNSKRVIDPADQEYIAGISAVEKIGVFVNADMETITEAIRDYRLTGIQLHGQETASFCAALKKATSVKLIKAFGVDENFDTALLTDYEYIVDFFLFDTKTPEHGGSGKKFNWQLLNRYRGNTPYFLSGGLDKDNILQAAQNNDPRLYGLDLNSKFEIEPGMKDIDLLTKTLNKIIS